MGPLSTLTAANDVRRDRAAAATTAAVRVALERLGDTAPENLAAAGRLRIAYPDDSLRELGERAGMTKYTVAARLRRLIAYAAHAERVTSKAAPVPSPAFRAAMGMAGHKAVYEDEEIVLWRA